MKTKRILAFILVLVMCIAVFPSRMLAAEENVTFTALDGTANNDTQGQGYSKLLDGSNFTKWCDKIGTVDGINYIPYIIFKASKQVIITDYTFVTGNDNSQHTGRNPKDWTLYGCNNYNEANKTGGTWTAIHSVTDDTVMEDKNNVSFKFTIANNAGMYKYYKLVITSNHGAQYDLMQLSEMKIGWRTAYNVTFDKNGGDTEASPNVIAGGGLPTQNPTRNGYSFDGWYTGNGAGDDWGTQFTAESTASADTTVYAKWSEHNITYSLNYENAGNYAVLGFGSGLPTENPTRSGFIFDGWYTKNGSGGDWGTCFAAGATVSSDITVYAKWNENVTFEIIDGTRGGVDDEDYGNLFDGNNSGSTFTKWCVHGGKGYLIIKAEKPVVLSSYTFITGNDNAQYSGRSPKNWTLSGCNDYNKDDVKSGTWTEIASVTDDTTIQDVNFTAYNFETNTENSYMYYKLDITRNAGGNVLQLCGLELGYEVAAEYAGTLVYFDKNGGDTMPSPWAIIPGGGLPTQNPTRNGFSFVGWYTKNGAGGDWGESFTADSVVSLTTTVYAKWNEHQITYNLNYEGAGDNTVLGFGSGLPSPKPNRSGYGFAGWYTKSGADGDWGTLFTEKTAVSADTTVYARWIEPVTLEIIGGDSGNVTDTVNEGYGNLFDGKNSGNTFTKWCLHKESGKLIIKATRPILLSSYTFITGNDNFQYKGRSPKTWALYGCNDYDPADSASGTWAEITSVTDDDTIQNVNFTPYTFKADAKASYMYYKLDIVKNAGSDVTQLCGLDFDYYVAAEYADALVYFDKNGGATMPQPQVIAAGGGLPNQNPTRNGYSFAGWYTKNGSDGDWGESFTAESAVSSTGTVYAKWTGHRITYSMNDGSEDAHAVLEYGNTPTNPVKSGRDFEGWYTKNGSDGDWGEKFTAQTTVTGSITVYAKWGNVKITFDKNGGDTEPVPTMIEQGEGLPTQNPTRNGCRFEGWYTKNGADDDWGEEFTAETVLSANATVYAKWHEYNITFKLNDGTESNYGIFGYTKAFPLPDVKKKNAHVSGWYTENGTNDNWGNLFSASTAVTTDMAVYAKWETSHTHCICGVDHAEVGDHKQEKLGTFKPIGTSEELLNASSGTADAPNYYYLTADIVIGGSGNGGWYVLRKNNFVLCLNGHKLAHSYSTETIEVEDGINFTVTDCVGTGTITHSDSSKNSVGVYINDGIFNMYNGNIVNNSSSAGGGVRLVEGTFNMYGGTISENSSANGQYTAHGGGVHLYSTDCTFNMYGGKISNNTATNGSGGGVYGTRTGNKINILGGEISGNTASGGGGGIRFSNGDIKIENALITKNTASANGGGIDIASASSFSMKNSTISENSATDGGGMEVSSNNLEMDNCEFFQNTATRYGGGIFVSSDNISIKNSTVSDNKALEGGGIFTYRKGKIENTEILRNEASLGGGLLLEVNNDEFTISDSTIANNKAKGTDERGGGIRIERGTIKIQDGTDIYGNSAKSGGGISFGGGALDLKNVSISGNTVTENGGGIYSNQYNSLTANGGVYIYDNILLDETGGSDESSGNTSGETGTTEGTGTPESTGAGGDDGGWAVTEPTGEQNNLYLARYRYYPYLANIKLTAAEIQTDTGLIDTKIGVTLEDNEKTISESSETDYSGCFVSDNLNYAVVYNDDGVLKLTEAYIVTFEYGDRSEKVSVVKNTPIAAPEDEPYIEGKTFIGWFIGDEEYDFTKAVKKNITLTARWLSDESVGVSINKNNIYVNVPESGAVLSVALYKDYVLTETITREVTENTTLEIASLGINKENIDKLSVVLLDSSNNPICEAVWLILRIPVFDVVFDKNGGTKDAEPKTLKSNMGLPTAEPQKNGYTFMGWYTKNGTGDDWGTEFTANADVRSNITVYAKWKKVLGVLSMRVLYASGTSSGGESATKLVDGRKTSTNGTKWCVKPSSGTFAEGKSVYAIIAPAESIKLTGYTITTANDTAEYSGRNPKSWKLYGSNDYTNNNSGATWVELASVTDDTLLPAENYASVHYDVTNNNTYYKYYKFEVTAIGNDAVLQIAELEFDYEECEHKWNLQSATGATCLTDAYEIRKCSLCDFEEKTIAAPPLGHNSDNNGNCSRCGKVAEVEVDGVNHSDFKQAFSAVASTGGSIKLIKDVEIDGAVNMPNDVTVTIDLNGYILRTKNSDEVIEIDKGTLNLIDSRPTAVNKLDTTNYPWVRAEDNADGNNIKTYSGGIITGGRIVVKTASHGFNMSAGTIAGCINGSMGTVYLMSNMVMSGNAAIRDCSCYSARAVYISSGSLTMNDNAAIYDCVAPGDYYNNAIYCSTTDGKITMNGSSSIKISGRYNAYAINSDNRGALEVNTSGTIEGDVAVDSIICADNCTNTTVFKGDVDANSISAGLIYGNVSGTINGCKVTYKMSDEENAETYAINVVKSGNKAVKPINPTADGKNFIEWRKDGTAYDFNSTVTADTALTAHWIVADVGTVAELKNALENNLFSIRLVSDITLDETVNISYPLTVDLNGYLLKYEGTTEAPYIFNVSEGKELTIKDTNTTRSHKFDKTNEKWALAATDATGNNIESESGGIIIGRINNSGILNINGPMFAATDGASGLINNSGTLNIEDCIIDGCSGTLINNSGRFNIIDGYISGADTAIDSVVNTGTISAKGGVISASVNNSGTISAAEDAEEFAVCKNIKNTGTISWGTYYGGITNSGDGTISGCQVHYTVDGDELALGVVPNGSGAIAPGITADLDYAIIGWYKDSALTKGWNFTSDDVTGDTTLYAEVIKSKVSTETELNNALAARIQKITLAADIELDESLLIERYVTLDLNGHVLSYAANESQSDCVIYVESNDNAFLKIIDSNPKAEHKFDTSKDLWVLAEDNASGTNIKTVYGGVITGGTGFHSDELYYGGGIVNTGSLTIGGGNIVGCSADMGGAIFNVGELGLDGCNILGCTATYGAGIYNAYYSEMEDTTVAYCTGVSYGNIEEENYTPSRGGGIYNAGYLVLVGSTVENCTADIGGGMSDQGSNHSNITEILETTFKNCEAEYGGGIVGMGMVGMFDSTVEKCKANDFGGGIVIGGEFHLNGSVKDCVAKEGAAVYSAGKLNACGGKIEGEVYNLQEIYADLDAISLAGDSVTAFTGKVINAGKIYDGMYYGGIKNITFTEGKTSLTGTIVSPAVTYMNGKAVYAVYLTSTEENAALPITPVKANSTFDGWYNGENVYGFDTPITENVTLTAKWSGEGVNASPEIEMTSTVISVVSGGENATLYVGAYKQTKLVGMTSKTITDDSDVAIASMGIDISKADTLKAFLWNNDMSPLCAFATASIDTTQSEESLTAESGTFYELTEKREFLQQAAKSQNHSSAETVVSELSKNDFAELFDLGKKANLNMFFADDNMSRFIKISE